MPPTISDDLVLSLEVQRFIAREVALLDDRRFEEWLGLFAEEIRYWMPVLVTTEDPALALVGTDGLAWFDEDHASLGIRVRRLASPQAHAEHPASRTRRFVFVTSVDRLDDHEVSVAANFAIYRSRRERDVDIFVGSRTDLLRRDGDSFTIVTRTLRLDQDIVENRDMSVLF
jgi:biphenyl 2,3-dioxygenase beta subunit